MGVNVNAFSIFYAHLLQYFMTVLQVHIALLSWRSASSGHGWTADHTETTPPTSFHLAPVDSNCQLSRHSRTLVRQPHRG